MEEVSSKSKKEQDDLEDLKRRKPIQGLPQQC